MIVKRRILNKIYPWLDSPHIIVIHGARRAGKTILLKILENELKRLKKSVLYMAVDQMLFEPFFKDPISFEKWLKKEGYLNSGPLYILLDEVQYLSDAALFLKVLFDRLGSKVKLIVSGSSSLELSKDKALLTGRKIEFSLQRFSFLEFLSLRLQKDFVDMVPISDIEQIKEIYSIYEQRLKELFLEYITWGGYPEVILEENPQKKSILLREILSSYIEKDVSGFLRIRQATAFNNLIRLLASQVGGLVNKTEICNTLGIRFETLNFYLDILKNTFIFDFIQPFFQNVRKEISKSPKVYAKDMGIVYYALKRKFDEYALIPGEIIENFVYRELMERFIESDIHFYRTLSGAEIDFVVEDKKFYLIESKFSNQKRFPKSIKNFIKNYLKDRSHLTIIITKEVFSYEGDIIYLPAVCSPLWEF